MPGKTVSVQKSLSSPALSFSIPLLDCRNTRVSLYPVLSGTESVNWSVGSNEQYISLQGATNGPSVKVKGIKNTGTSDSYMGKLTVKVKVRGEEVSATQYARVGIPTSLSAYAFVTAGSTSRTAILWAHPSPYNLDAGTFHWSTDNGIFIKKAIISDPGIIAHTEKDFHTMASDYLIPTDEISPEMLEELVAKANIDNELTEDNASITLTRAATLSSGNTLQSVIVGVSAPGDSITGDRQTQYFQLENPNELKSGGTTYPPLDPGDSYPALPDSDDPSYVILVYSGNSPTVKCRLTSSCMNPVEATIRISGIGYSCGYSIENRSIVIINDDLNSSGNGNPGSNTMYMVSIYDDYGMVKQVKISSSEAKVFIPMTGYPAGYYYVNIADETGNVITRQAVRVQ
jgi:hypothetical protein